MTDRYIALDVQTLEREIDRLMLEFPELAEDSELREGVITGETDIDKVIVRLLTMKADADIMVTGIAELVSSLTERSDRFKRKSDATRSLIKRLMLAANLPKLQLPMATVSIGAGRTSVNVTDIEALGQGFYKSIRQADKTAIKTALEAGAAVPGAELIIGEPSLTIRGK